LAVRIIEGDYEFPTQSHAGVGPACAVADGRDDAATVWTSSQKPHDCALGIAELLELPPEKVRAIWRFGTGGYARDAQGDATADAAVLSKHLKRPVRVQYMRHESLAWDPKSTATVNRSSAGFDASGKLIAYENISKAFSMEDCSTRERHAGMALGAKPDWRPSLGIPGNGYTFENARWGWELIAPLMDRSSPLRSTHLRDPFGPPIIFGANPSSMSWRSQPKPIRSSSVCAISRKIASMCASRRRQAIWLGHTALAAQRPEASDVAVGRGFAYRQLADAYIALIAEVRVHRDSGVIEIACLVWAHDCGVIVNPETIRHVIDR
jgi:nicotinate dehydrogenase subunit B